MSDAGTFASLKNNARGARRALDQIHRLLPRKSSPTLRPMASFDPVNLVPNDHQQSYPSTPRRRDLKHPQETGPQPDFGAVLGGGPMSARGSVSPPSVFDGPDDQQDPQAFTEPTTALGSADDEPSYDLKPPPPSVSHDNAESLAVRFFSTDHLDVILRDHAHASKFSRFLAQYRPAHGPTLARYLETKKAITAIEYANAIAEQLPTNAGHPPYVAAVLDDRFEAKSKRIVEDLVEDALPAYVTHRLVTLVTDTLVKEITGNSVPIMRELVPSLAEVYCVTDPSLPDNPIVYASEGESICLWMKSVLLTGRLRILQHLTVRARIRDRPELSLPSRTQNQQCLCQTSYRCACTRAGDLRGHPQLPPRWQSVHEPAYDRPSLR